MSSRSQLRRERNGLWLVALTFALILTGAVFGLLSQATVNTGAALGYALLAGPAFVAALILLMATSRPCPTSIRMDWISTSRRKNMIKRIWAKLTGGRLVWLKDFDGERTLAISRVDAWGTRYAKRYWPFNVLIVVLKDDGTVSNSYVKLWTFHK